MHELRNKPFVCDFCVKVFVKHVDSPHFMRHSVRMKSDYTNSKRTKVVAQMEVPR